MLSSTLEIFSNNPFCSDITLSTFDSIVDNFKRIFSTVILDTITFYHITSVRIKSLFLKKVYLIKNLIFTFHSCRSILADSFVHFINILSEYKKKNKHENANAKAVFYSEKRDAI
jgi:hypothetical protein